MWEKKRKQAVTNKSEDLSFSVVFFFEGIANKGLSVQFRAC